MKVCSIVGARPNFIKLAPLSKELRLRNNEVIIHTGQHYDESMSDAFFKDIHIPEPDYNLGVKESTHAFQIGNMMMKIEPILMNEEPDVVIVFGDTNSTLAGAITASKLNIPVVHIEAGCRSYDMTMPEETNRIMIDHISDTLYAPTHLCENILKRENVYGNIECLGDVMVDILYEIIMKTASMTVPSSKYAILTIHRPSNTNSISKIIEILEAANKYDNEVLFPVHPRVNKMLELYDLKKKYSNILFIEPLNYSMMIHYIRSAQFIMTDSGGMQKEAYMLKVPCITLRNTTEWAETLEYGWNQLVPIISREYLSYAIESLKKPSAYVNIFGNIGVCARIINSMNRMY